MPPEMAPLEKKVLDKTDLDKTLFQRNRTRGGKFDEELTGLNVGEQLVIQGAKKVGVQGAIQRLRKNGGISEEARFRYATDEAGNIVVGRFA